MDWSLKTHTLKKLFLHFWESKCAKIMKFYDVTKRSKKPKKTRDFRVYWVGRGGQTNIFCLALPGFKTLQENLVQF